MSQTTVACRAMRHFVITANSTGKELSDYRRVLAEQFDRFPGELQTYIAQCSLHDAWILEWRMDSSALELRLLFRADLFPSDDSGATQLPIGSGTLLLTYTGVTGFDMSLCPEHLAQTPAGPGLGDVDHDRLSIVSSGHVQHRILFCSGAAMRITFTGFSFRQSLEAQRESGE